MTLKDSLRPSLGSVTLGIMILRDWFCSGLSRSMLLLCSLPSALYYPFSPLPLLKSALILTILNQRSMGCLPQLRSILLRLRDIECAADCDWCAREREDSSHQIFVTGFLVALIPFYLYYFYSSSPPPPLNLGGFIPMDRLYIYKIHPSTGPYTCGSYGKIAWNLGSSSSK